jgi:predicted ATPase
MSKNSKLFVLSGAPSSGKTTLIRELEKRGFKVVHEVAREYIEEELSKGKTLEKIREDELSFQREIVKRKVKIEEELPENEIIFLDRGIPDGIAYCELFNVESEWIKKISKNRYSKVFILEDLDFVEDSVRIEDEETAKKIGKKIFETYLNLGYRIVYLKKESVENRIELILKSIGKN